MEYYPSSNYAQYQPYYCDNNYQPYTYGPHETRYVENYSNYTQNYDINSYQLSHSEPLIGYYYSTYNNDSLDDLVALKDANLREDGEYFYDPVSTQFVVSYSNNNNNNVGNEIHDNDVDFPEYNREPYHGGYDIDATYGKALPASANICYPPSNKVDQKPEPDFVQKANVIVEPEKKPEINMGQDINEDQDEDEDDIEDEDDDADEDNEDEDYSDDEKEVIETKPSEVTQEEMASEPEEEQEENRGGEMGIRRQIPAGYGLEAIDICDGLFGGYFPCLLKRDKSGNCDECGSQVKVKRDDYYEIWQGTVDYLFGNPNPYGGGMPEKGSYGDPMYCYRRHSPQESIVGEVKYLENSTWVDHSRDYYYG